ncbi:MAG TPA: hypothetical protein VMA74_19520 [Dyella sp.]|uniref:hypothetical protein n=1 Tax=Dyella sp. TaxID=1869338 RepID=UPI002BDD055B|nr:hypothetical protein [Dyella sp.]HUB91920.1 hypothetical protein [Dyella sp.]
MSITSRYEVDHSSSLAKRFAGLAMSYMDDPTTVKNPDAQVPLENLFRILEMYRYDAFEDEERSGVLALEGFGSPLPLMRAQKSSWHTQILDALEKARQAAFPSETKDVAVQRLEDGLRQLSREGRIADPLANSVRGFFTTFAASI